MEHPNVNPLIADFAGKVGSILVELPTAGAFYGPGMFLPGTDPTKLAIMPISVVDEINFKDPFKIVSGMAVLEMLSKVAKILRPSELCKIDVDLILIAARVASYGSKLDVTVRCQNMMAVKSDADGNELLGPCGESVDLKIDLNRIISQFQNVGTVEQWQTTLPNKQIVQLMPMPYTSVVRGMMEVANQAKEAKQLELQHKDKDIYEVSKLHESTMDKAAQLQVLLMIDSIASVRTTTGTVVSDKRQIAEWLRTVPVQWILSISDMLNEKTKLLEGYGMTSYKCPSCSFKNELPVNMDMTSFFSVGSRKQQP